MRRSLTLGGISLSEALIVQIKRLLGSEGLPLPQQMSELAAGFDVVAALPEDSPIELAPGAAALVPAGFAMAMPAGFEAQVRPRSGLALKYGITVLNSPGTIDADYRGEVKVILINLGRESFVIRRGERIAQMVIQQVPQVRLLEVEELGATERGAGGFGHTGK